MGRRALGLGAVVAALTFGAESARGGTYDVYSCSFGGASYGPNHAWAPTNNSLGGDPTYTEPDTACAAANDPLAALVTKVPVAFGNQVSSVLSFTAPSGTVITDFDLYAQHLYRAVGLTTSAGKQPDNTMYTMAVFGSYAFSLTGQYDAGVTAYVAAENHWWGSGGPAVTGPIHLTRAGSDAAKKQDTAQAIALYAGCYNAAGCTLDSTSYVQLLLYGSRITIRDDSAPALTSFTRDSGLFAPGTRSGDEPVTLSASDNTGIKRAELVDVTDPSQPVVVGQKDFACDYSAPRPCTDVRDQTVAADPPVAGRRSILLRLVDAAGNETVSSPFAVNARGRLNGANGGDGARLTAGFPATVYRRSKSGKRYRLYVLRPSRTVSYGNGGTIRGTLRNASGQPVAGAELRILVRENRSGAPYVDRGGVTTDENGRVSLGIPAGSSRLYQLTYKAYVGDETPAARSRATLNTRARITIRATRHVKARGVARFRGTLVGKPLPRRGVTLELQAYQRGRGWRTVDTARTGNGGRYSARYRFNAAHGSFRFRVRLRPIDAYPYARGSSKRLRVRVG